MFDWTERLKRQVFGRLGTAKVLLWHPTKRLWVVGVLVIVGAYDVIVAQFVGEDTQDKFPQVADILPGWSWQAWVIVSLAVILIVVFERAHRLLSRNYYSLSRKRIGIAGIIPAVPEQRKQKGIYDFLKEGPKATKDIGSLFLRFNKETEALNSKLKNYTPRMINASLKQRQTLISKETKPIRKYAGKVNRDVERLRRTTDIFDESYVGQITWYQNNETPLSEYSSIQQGMEGILEGTQAALGGITAMKDSIDGLHGRNLRSDLNEACTDLSVLLSRYVKATETVRGAARSVIAMISTQPTPDTANSQSQ